MLTNSCSFVDCFSNWLTCCLFSISPVVASCACQFHVLCLMNSFLSVFSYDVLHMKLFFPIFYYVQFHSSSVHNTTLSIYLLQHYTIGMNCLCACLKIFLFLCQFLKVAWLIVIYFQSAKYNSPFFPGLRVSYKASDDILSFLLL